MAIEIEGELTATDLMDQAVRATIACQAITAAASLVPEHAKLAADGETFLRDNMILKVTQMAETFLPWIEAYTFDPETDE